MPGGRKRGSQRPRQEHGQGDAARSPTVPPTVFQLVELAAGSPRLPVRGGAGDRGGSTSLSSVKTVTPSSTQQHKLATNGRYPTVRGLFL